MYLAREHTGATLPAIGRGFGGRNHTTVMHACRRTAERLASDPEAFDTVGSDVVRTAVHARSRAADRLRRIVPQPLCITFPQRSGGFAPSCQISTALTAYSSFLEVSHETRDVIAASCSRSCRSLARRLDPQRRPGAVRRPDRGRGRHSSCAPPTWRWPCASRSTATVVREGTVVLPARLLLDVVRQLPGGDVSLELRPAEQDVEVVAARRASTCARCAPRTSPRCPSRAATRSSTCRRRRSSRRSPGRPLGLARRDPSDPHRHPGLGVGLGAADGRDRLLPPERQGDPLEPPLAGGFEANIPARALQELGRWSRPTARTRSASACAPTRSSSRSAASCCPRG